MYRLAVLSAAFVGSTLAAPAADVTVDARYGGKNCRDIKVPVTVDTIIKQFNYKATDEEIDTTNTFLASIRHGGDMSQLVANDNFHIKKDYTLAATLCHPSSGPSSTLQILTHGVGFDRSYWDYPFANHNYSYVSHALSEAGHSTLSWDRLGIAESSHGDPVQEIQLALEVEALYQLTLAADQGRLCGLPAGHKFTSKIHVGHSFGSAMTYALSSQHPSITDAIVLTGFSQAPNYIGLFLLGSNFAPVAHVSDALRRKYATGYIAPKTSIGVHMDFFGPGDFDPAMLADATKNGQPAAVAELFTVGDGAATASNFTGAVQIITGEFDLPFCGGNCNAVEGPNPSGAADILQLSKPSFQHAAAFETTIVKGAGHGLNFGYSHTVTYKSIIDFLKRQKL